ncbi:cell filamentation protein Fic [Lysinibacillus fusiformis]|uniref:Fic family protein n=1 Tax=Lysinibacillus fusiformis TaxID=28031 RepID=UPI000E20629E|nr:Fic family protein [Lysinibacillus fusiformis]RDV24714.1 cell filamentation protein Fic [Lysinibacillus fusiformis]
MRNFFEDQYKYNGVNQIINLVSEISEYKGKLTAYQEQRSDMFTNLENAMPIQYIKNYVSIYEDIKVSNKRLKELILEDIIPQSISEDAIFCYYETLTLVREKSNNFPISPDTIQELHFQLIHFITSDSAKWRQKPFSIPGIPEKGMHINVYRPLPPENIQMSVEQLCKQYNLLNCKKELPTIILIAHFIFNLYCIIPFSQGNGRLTLMLMQLLLIRSGHTFVKYVCLDEYIKKRESEYYEAVYKSSANWYCNEHNISFWLKIFLNIILTAYKNLHNRVQDSLSSQTKIERIRNFVLNQEQPFTKDYIRSIYPDIAESTISRALTDLQLIGEIKLISKGRNACWVKV